MTPARGLGGERGLTLIEVVAATVIAALLALAVGSAARIVFTTERAAQEGARSAELGLSLLREIAALPYADPQDGETDMGPEPGEWKPPTDRTLFDDVDDYAIWDGSYALLQKDATPIDIEGYRRRVEVEYVLGTDFATTSGVPTGFKRITVTVLRDGELVDTFVTVRVEGGRHVDVGG